MSEGLKPEDLLGLVDVVVKRTIISKRLPDTYVLTVEYNGKEYKVGIIGKQTLECVLKKGYKKDGKVHLLIPSTALGEEGAGWINTPY
jgi:hypothetical protein